LRSAALGIFREAAKFGGKEETGKKRAVEHRRRDWNTASPKP